MIQSPDDRRTPLSPQLAMRVAILGGVAFALFAIVFFRLWFLQVLSGDQYLAQASTNRVRDVVIQAPRGEIVDRNGHALVSNRWAVAVVVSPPRLPRDEAERQRLYRRLSRVLGMSTRPTRCTVGDEVVHVMELDCRVRKGIFQLPYADVTVKTDVPRAVYSYLSERSLEFPGVSIMDVALRSYPFREAGAQMFGTIGQISEEQLGQEHYRGVRGGTLVGKSGLEYTYDRYLRGQNGAQRIEVDALGRPKRYLNDREAVPGNNVRLSIDVRLQRAGQAALEEGIGIANASGYSAAGGAFVALDPRNGEVLAMGSAPSFDPNVLTRPISEKRYEELLGRDRNYPTINRAVAAQYPIGSTFKIVTAAAALAEGIITPETVYVDTGRFIIGAQRWQNAGGAVFGPTALRRAMQVSVDTYFYELGRQLNEDPRRSPNGGPLQEWARKFGFGRETGIDLGEETSGTIPSQRWRSQRDALERRCRKRNGGRPCGYSDLSRGWTVGDNVNLAIGQGDFLATPLQLAVAYAAIENGGTVVRPHVGLEITAPDGTVLQKIDPKPARRIEIPGLEAIQQGLHDAAMAPEGTSFDVFGDFPKPVYGKTGTAQHYLRDDQSWYVAYVPDEERPIVVAATIEHGGFGAESAAPVVRLILSEWFGIEKRVVTGTSRTY
jgi:penicillin-binding protein 2